MRSGKIKKGTTYLRKSGIYYPRTYRSLIMNRKKQIIFSLICFVPCFLVLLLCYPQITLFIVRLTIYCISDAVPELEIAESGFIPLIGNLHYLDLPTNLPDFSFVIVNILVTLLLCRICLLGTRRQQPIAIYLLVALLFHLPNCIFFAFAPEYFPYTASQYSELYMKLQVGIWFCVMFLTFFAVGFLSNAKLSMRFLTYFKILTYSFIYGVIRYIVFMYIIYAGTSIYMAMMFFTFGPFLDFLYVVYFYSAFVDKTIKSIGRGNEEAWKWY